MKFEIEVPKKEKQEIEVDFPLYFQRGDAFDSGGWYEAYSRVDADGWEYEIHVNDRGEWQYEKSRIDLASSLGYRLVQKKYDYTLIKPDKFYAKVAEMQKLLAEIPPAGGISVGA